MNDIEDTLRARGLLVLFFAFASGISTVAAGVMPFVIYS